MEERGLKGNTQILLERGYPPPLHMHLYRPKVTKQFLTPSQSRLLIKWNHSFQGKTQHQNSQYLHFVVNFAINCWCKCNQNCYYASSMPIYNSQCKKRRDTLLTLRQTFAFFTFFIKFKESLLISKTKSASEVVLFQKCALYFS